MIIAGNADAADPAETVTYDGHGRRDPFTPLVTASSQRGSGVASVSAPDEITIEGIVYDPKGSVLIVNGQVLKEGQTVGELKVLKIEPKGARFLLNGAETYVPLYRDEAEGKKA